MSEIEPAKPEEPVSEAHSAPLADRAVFWTNALAWGAVLLGAIVYAALSAFQIGHAYVDFGDGNYLYIASRMADGLVPYRDIMAPQPPLHLLLGSWVMRLGGTVGGELLLIRWLSILLRIGIAFAIASIARHACRSIWPAIAAAFLFLFLPVGFTWSLGYQSEPLEILFLALMVRLILPLRGWPLAGAGVLAALAAFTNMTALPYAFLVILWLIWRRGWLSLAFIAPFAAVMALGIIVCEAWTSGHYLENVFFNQVGTYPQGELLRYAFGKIWREGAGVVVQEGFVVALSLLAMAYCIWCEKDNALEFLALFGLASLGSIVFVSKGGTADYIFTIGEPYAAIFAACLFAWAARPVQDAIERPPMFHRLIALLALAAAVLVMLWRVVIWWQNARMAGQALFLIQTFVEPVVFLAFLGVLLAMAAKRADVRRGISALAIAAGVAAMAVFGWHSALVLRFQVYGGAVYQMTAAEVDRMADLISRHTDPRDAILAPPWFAYYTGRTLAGEYSEIFIWTIGYANEANDRPSARPASPVDGPFTAKALEIADLLQRQRIPLVILDDEQTGRIPEIKAALYGSEDFPLLNGEDLTDPSALARALSMASDPASAWIVELLSRGGAGRSLLSDLNALVIRSVVERPDGGFQSGLYAPEAFANVSLTERTREMLARPLAYEDVLRLNRRLLAEAYPGLIILRPQAARYQELTQLQLDTRDTPLRFFVPAEGRLIAPPPYMTFDEMAPSETTAPPFDQTESPVLTP